MIERALMSQAEVAEPLGWSQSKVAYLETATSAVKLNDLDKLLDLFDADKQTREDCRDLANAGRKQLPRRKGVLRNRFEGDMRLVVDMEDSATTVWCHNSMVIPGLLRTEVSDEVTTLRDSKNPDGGAPPSPPPPGRTSAQHLPADLFRPTHHRPTHLPIRWNACVTFRSLPYS